MTHEEKRKAIQELTKTEFTWQSRYSSTDKSDKHGRWARLCFYRGFLISWISRIEHIQHGTFYIVNDFFPSNGNSDPCYSVKETYFEKAKEGVEIRFSNFIKYCS